jgi:predicted nucleic acid-binding protein
MPNGSSNLFWDTCVFSAVLYDETQTYDVTSIEQYLAEAKAGKYRIYTSSIVFAEIASSKVKRKGTGSIDDLISDLVGATVVVDASVNIFQMAGRLKDIPYKKNNSKVRMLSTGDAVMFATALYIQDGYDVAIDAFHTFDDAKKRFIPLLSYHEWCEGLTGAKAMLARRVCALNRTKPIHPTPLLPGT